MFAIHGEIIHVGRSRQVRILEHTSRTLCRKIIAKNMSSKSCRSRFSAASPPVNLDIFQGLMRQRPLVEHFNDVKAWKKQLLPGDASSYQETQFTHMSCMAETSMHHHSCNEGEKHRNIDCLHMCFTDSMQGTSAAKRIHADFSGELECMSMPHKKQRHGARTFWELIVILDPPADVPVFTLLTLLADLQSLLHLLRIGCLVAGKARPRPPFLLGSTCFFVFLRFLLARTAVETLQLCIFLPPGIEVHFASRRTQPSWQRIGN